LPGKIAANGFGIGSGENAASAAGDALFVNEIGMAEGGEADHHQASVWPGKQEVQCGPGEFQPTFRAGATPAMPDQVAPNADPASVRGNRGGVLGQPDHIDGGIGRDEPALPAHREENGPAIRMDGQVGRRKGGDGMDVLRGSAGDGARIQHGANDGFPGNRIQIRREPSERDHRLEKKHQGEDRERFRPTKEGGGFRQIQIGHGGGQEERDSSFGYLLDGAELDVEAVMSSEPEEGLAI